MPHAIWKGHISFGLVSIPVALYSAERRSDLHFRMLDSRNHARVRYERVNETTGEEVPWNQIVKGFEFDGGSYVVLGEEDFRRAAVKAARSVAIEDFVDRDAIDVVHFDKPYYLTPATAGEKGYVLLRETLRAQNKVGIAKVVIRTRQHLAAIIPEGDGLVLMLMRFAQELRNLADFDLPTQDVKAYDITKKELDMASRLVEAMSTEWNPQAYRDDYREQLMNWIEQKIESGEFTRPAEAVPEEEPPATINIMEMLQRSVEEQAAAGERRQRRAAG